MAAEVWIPAAGLRHRDPLDAMDAALMLQPAISAASLDLKDDLLDGAQTGLVGVDNLRLPPLALGVPRVGFEQVGGEQAGLVAAGAGPDLHDHVLGIVGIAGHQGELQVERDLVSALLQACHLLFGEGHQLLIGFVAEHRANVLDLLHQLSLLP